MLRMLLQLTVRKYGYRQTCPLRFAQEHEPEQAIFLPLTYGEILRLRNFPH
jgi:hypothetical protein